MSAEENSIFWKNLYSTVGLPTSVEEVVAVRKRQKRLYPRLTRWQELKADVPGFRWIDELFDQWPDQAEEWDEEVEELVSAGRANDPCEALQLLYNENEEFRQSMDEIWEHDAKFLRLQDRRRRMLVWQRAAWTAVWLHRMRAR